MSTLAAGRGTIFECEFIIVSTNMKQRLTLTSSDRERRFRPRYPQNIIEVLSEPHVAPRAFSKLWVDLTKWFEKSLDDQEFYDIHNFQSEWLDERPGSLLPH